MGLISKYIPVDKQLHLIVGFFIGLIVVAISREFLTGCVVAGAAGISKECYDWVSNYLNAKKGLPKVHDVDFFDYLATQIGGVVGAGLVTLAIIFGVE